MGLIMQNGISYGGVDIVKLTQAEYDALPESKNSDGILYAITDGEGSSSGGGTSKPVELTKAQYEALGESTKTDGILYAITDGDELSAKNMAYDGSVTGLGNNVQSAIDELNSNFSNSSLIYNEKTDYFGMTYNGEWKDVVFAGFKAVYLYMNGEEFTSRHGGTWTFNSNQSTANYYDFNNKGASITKTKNADNIKMRSSVPTTAGALACTSCYLSAAIDLTNYTKLVVRATRTGTKNASIKVFNKVPKNVATNSQIKSQSIGSGTNIETVLDISSVVGLNYILLETGGYAGDSGGSSGSVELTVYEVRLEP